MTPAALLDADKYVSAPTKDICRVNVWLGGKSPEPAGLG